MSAQRQTAATVRERLAAELGAMKRTNAAWRRAGRPAPDNRPGWEKTAGILGETLDAMRPHRLNQARNLDLGAREPYASFEVRHLAARVKGLTGSRARQEQPGAAQREIMRGPGWALYEDAGDDRTTVRLDDAEDPVLRSGLRAAGFRFSSTRGAWVRQRSAAAWYAALRTLGEVPDAR